MPTYVIGYDLHPSKGQTYDELTKAIQAFGTYWHHLDSTWLIVTDLSAAQVRDRLTPHIWQDDRLLVAPLVKQSWASFGFSKQAADWLQKNA